MSALVFLVPLALVLGGAALSAFLWSLRSGQYDDLEGAAARVLLGEENDSIDDAINSSNQHENDRHSKASGAR